MPHQRIDALHVAVLSCNVRRRRATLLASTATTTRLIGKARLLRAQAPRTHRCCCVHICTMPSQRIDARCMAALSCDECRRRATLLASTPNSVDTGLYPMTGLHTHRLRDVHIRTKPHQRIDAVHMAVASCNVCRRRATLSPTRTVPVRLGPAPLQYCRQGRRQDCTRPPSSPCSRRRHASLVH